MKKVGILDGENPIEFKETNALTVFLMQVCFIIIITRLLQYPCALLRQPQVIAEVFTGVIVGPTVMGQIPGFTDVMFPSGSMASLNLASSIGLILFVFIVGLGLNPAKILRYAKETAGVSLVGTFLPFALGAVASFGLITQMEPEERQHDFGIFAMFCGMAMSITAFPMLARVSSELGLVKTAVGSVAIGAAAVNDALARCILVLFTALAYAYNLLDALYVLLAVIAYIAILTVVGRPILVRWFLPRFYNPDNGPSQLVVTVLLIVALLSSFFTQVMGFGAALGAFAVGVIVPHDGGLAVKLVEKIEDLVLVFFLPLYFALTGINAEIQLLDDAYAWLLVLLSVVVAIGGKVIGCTGIAVLTGMSWREAFAIGFLMNCKGLVEVVVLNVALDAGVINKKLFTIMIIMTMLTTLLAGPMAYWLYPPHYQRKAALKSRPVTRQPSRAASVLGNPVSSNGILFCVTQMRQVPATMQLLRMFKPLTPTPTLPQAELRMGTRAPDPTSATPDIMSREFFTQPDPSADADAGVQQTASVPSHEEQNLQWMLREQIEPAPVHLLRILELGQRNSTVMKCQQADMIIRFDPVLSILQSFAELYGVMTRGGIVAASPSRFASAVAGHAVNVDVELLMLTWPLYGKTSEANQNSGNGRSNSARHSGNLSDGGRPRSGSMSRLRKRKHAPKSNDIVDILLRDSSQRRFIGGALAKVHCSCAVLIDRGLGQREVSLRIPKAQNPQRRSGYPSAMEMHEAMLRHTGVAASNATWSAPIPSSSTSTTVPNGSQVITGGSNLRMPPLSVMKALYAAQMQQQYHTGSTTPQNISPYSTINYGHLEPSANSTVSSFQQLVQSQNMSTVNSVNSARSVTFADMPQVVFSRLSDGYPENGLGTAVVYYTGGVDGRLALDIARTMAGNGVRTIVYWYHMPLFGKPGDVNPLVDKVVDNTIIPTMVGIPDIVINMSDDTHTGEKRNSLKTDDDGSGGDSTEKTEVPASTIITDDLTPANEMPSPPLNGQETRLRERYLADRALLSKLDPTITVHEIAMDLSFAIKDLANRCDQLTSHDVIILGRGRRGEDKVSNVIGLAATALLKTDCRASLIVARGVSKEGEQDEDDLIPPPISNHDDDKQAGAADSDDERHLSRRSRYAFSDDDASGTEWAP